jgi:hypothetical protein
MALCADYLYPNNPKISLGFTNCLITKYRDIPSRSLVQSCALEHAVDFDKLNQCISDNGHGEELLRNSVLQSKAVGVKYSCTVRVADSTWCVRDGGAWKQCEGGSKVDDLVTKVKKLAETS